MIRRRALIAVLLSLALVFQGVVMAGGMHDHGAGAPAHDMLMVDVGDSGGGCGSPDAPDGEVSCLACASCTPGLTQTIPTVSPPTLREQSFITALRRNIHAGPEGPPPRAPLLF